MRKRSAAEGHGRSAFPSRIRTEID